MSRANIIRTSLITGLALIAVSSTIQAGTEVDDKESLALRKIMQDMGDNMQSITDGISREDWQQVEKNAALVAEHPQPPLGEKIRILSFIGSDVSKFKGYDGKTHDAARILGEVAAEQDSYGVIQAFSVLQNTCLACHQRFRKPFREHFYGSR